jgi:hypothetical protein
MAAELWEFIQQENPVVHPRHVARPWHLTAPDPPHLGAGVVRGAVKVFLDIGLNPNQALSYAMRAQAEEGLLWVVSAIVVAISPRVAYRLPDVKVGRVGSQSRVP